MLTPDQIREATRPKKTWFFKRGDGKIFAVEEKEAWNLLNQRSDWARKDFEMIGCSDGLTYQKIVRESATIKRELQEKVESEHKTLRAYLSVLEKLKFEDILDDEHEKVKRAKEQIAKTESVIDKYTAELNDINRTVVDKAFQAELEIAKENNELPRNHDVITPGADNSSRGKIMSSLPV